MRNSLVRIGVIILAASLAGACSLINKTAAPDDNAIVSSIQAKLFQDPVLKTENIQVVSQKGVVVLSGTVGSGDEKSAVESLANKTSGVSQVIDQLTVSAPAAEAQATPPPAPTPEERKRPEEAPRPKKHHPSEQAQAAEPAPAPDEQAAEAAPAPAPAAAAPAPAPQPDQAPPQPPPPPPPVQVTIPAGTVVSVQTIDAIDSAHNRAGEEFGASLSAPVVVGNQVVIPKGSDAKIRLVQANAAGHMTGVPELKLELISVSANGTDYTVESDYYDLRGPSRGKRTAETVGGGAIVGGLLGAIIGHGKGAVIGSAIGAGAGTAAEAGTQAQQVKVPSETKIDFTLKGPFTVTMNPS